MFKLYRYRDFYKAISLATIFVMFCLFTYKSFIESTINTYLSFTRNSPISWTSGYLISFILSYGFYTLAAKALMLILSSRTLVKAFLFRDYYLEGSWVGFVPSKKGISYIVEKVSQDMDKFSIQGISYRLENEYFLENCRWESTIMNIQYGEEHFYYAYDNIDTPEIYLSNHPTNNSEQQETNKNLPRTEAIVESLTYQGFARFRIESAARSKSDFLNGLKLRSVPKKVFTMRGSLKDFRTTSPRPDVKEIKVSNSKEIDYYELVKLAKKYHEFINEKSRFND